MEFTIPQLSDVNLTIFNVLGQRIKTIQMTNKSAGKYSVIWNGTNDLGAKVSTGIYFYRIDAGKYYDIKKMVFLK
ncbi:MAG: FlgD immunoglobulin-like domain containing protein [Candidatus Marinimicrobia bacterium]|nr:FlgD immunoglobulin-like domain containing protein [Candidatus Neomarinimicrobiota bacterium]